MDRNAEINTRARGSRLSPYAENVSISVPHKYMNSLASSENEKEIEEVIKILAYAGRSGRNRDNPILVGDATLARSFIAKEAIRRLVTTSASLGRQGRDVWSLNLDAIVAEVLPSEAQERLIAVLTTLRDMVGKLVLFVDDFHRLLASDPERYPVDVGPWLNPVLAHRELQILGTTNLIAYQRYIEADPALQRRMYPIFIDNPTD